MKEERAYGCLRLIKIDVIIVLLNYSKVNRRY